MSKSNEEVKSSRKSLDMNNIIMVLISVTLIASLVVNCLLLGRLTKISEGSRSQDTQPVAADTGDIGEQGQFSFLPITPDMYKIRDIYQQIINREVVRDDYLIGISIDDQLKEDIKEYNELVPILKGFFSYQAFRTLKSLFMLEDEDDEDSYKPSVVKYLELPADFRRYVEIITDLSLYRNCAKLMSSDPRLVFIISVESGGSYGMWPYFWHTEYLRGHEDIKERLNRLFDLVDSIIVSLDKEYEDIYHKELEQIAHAGLVQQSFHDDAGFGS
jgi:hypothetical protein